MLNIKMLSLFIISSFFLCNILSSPLGNKTNEFSRILLGERLLSGSIKKAELPVPQMPDENKKIPSKPTVSVCIYKKILRINDNYFVSVCDFEIKILNSSLNLYCDLLGHSVDVYDVFVFPDERIGTSTRNKEFVIWDSITCAVLNKRNYYYGPYIAFAAKDNSYFYVSDFKDRYIDFFDTDLNLRNSIYTSLIMPFLVRIDDNYIVSASENSLLQIWSGFNQYTSKYFDSGVVYIGAFQDIAPNKLYVALSYGLYEWDWRSGNTKLLIQDDIYIFDAYSPSQFAYANQQGTLSVIRDGEIVNTRPSIPNISKIIWLDRHSLVYSTSVSNRVKIHRVRNDGTGN